MTERINVDELATFDAAACLTDEASIAAYLADIREANNPALLAAALEDVARARAMNEAAQDGQATGHP